METDSIRTWGPSKHRSNMAQETKVQEESGETIEEKKRGGRRHVKITDEHKVFLEQWIDANPAVTLKDLQSKLECVVGVKVCLSTVGNAVNGMLYTSKMLHHEPSTMNSPANKAKRRDFLIALTSAIGNGKRIVWQDETNFNVWCTRGTGWSRVGQRAVAPRCTTKGQNLHIIGAVEQSLGMVYYTIREGSFKKEDFLEWLKSLVDNCEIKGIAPDELAVVIDNAPAHSIAERIVDYRNGVQVIRLGSYSPALNGIESCWSVVKSSIKKQLAERQQELVNTPPGITQVAHRRDIMIQVARRAVDSIDQILVMRCLNHGQKHWPTVMTSVIFLLEIDMLLSCC